MSNLILVDNYLKILQEIGRWKVISYIDLYNSLYLSESYSNFTRKIKKLEKGGFVKCLLGNNRRKYIHLTESGCQLSSSNVGLIDEVTLNHDLITTNVVNQLTKHKTFLSGMICSREIEGDLIPDGVVFGRKKEIDFKMAIEVELTQKSKRRVIEKFGQYAKSSEYDYCLYVINKESIYRSYTRIIKGMSEEVRRRIIFIVDKNLSPSLFDWNSDLCFFNEEGKKFNEIID